MAGAHSPVNEECAGVTVSHPLVKDAVEDAMRLTTPTVNRDDWISRWRVTRSVDEV